MILIGKNPHIFTIRATFYAMVPLAPGSKVVRKKRVLEFNNPVLDVMVGDFADFFRDYPYITKDGWFIFHQPVKAKLQEAVKNLPDAMASMEKLEVDGRYAVDIEFLRHNVDGTPSIGTDLESE